MTKLAKWSAPTTERDARVELAAAYRMVHDFGWTDLGATHLSAAVPGEDAYLMLQSGLMFHEVTASNLVKIGDDGGGSRPLACAGAFHHDAAYKVPLGDHRIQHAVHMGNRIFQRHHAWMHTLLQPSFRQTGNAQHLNAIAKLGGKLHIQRGDIAHTFDENLVKTRLPAKADARQQRQFVGCIDIIHIKAGICLGIAQRLRLR